ncbi:tRNA (adenosine(37)-N6)-threonylcarbamoyltransferase complex dimerization subunit type 1 TsaB [Ancylomarina longa]|uniref:tRNA (Adenosine(37)-N6)-threonylcarbamoyltransferase complex dimerization subunit type 1 TsaB n=1 Tax=Ancylomarina longa TaxID=2487017 RepID=A0A434AV93_9BACT|nr:tRNA (adenosine(37)-N6)-threonylcarbamoyltransferase complex dimerization subunit type 1 TsaB [Ancylomarina longa]RUT78391.1 tRNA (adenosine(37)-N6)-threonylcarbamoyltransferase complex dimerization subunit type 1 TsaB [Ancylomarina longa]
MALILNIETSTAVCSISLGKDGKLLALKENKEGMKHASHLSVFIQNILKENDLLPTNLDGVAISMGPGSYTGLRIGVSTAKGICFGANLPLMAISTLQIMALTVIQNPSILSTIKNKQNAYFCPMIDARRMEVYTAFYNIKNEIINDITASIIDADSYAKELLEREIVFFGDGAQKCTEVIDSKNGIFIDNIYPSASGMVEISEQKFQGKQFEDVAYFEPFYLKDFVATTPKKNIFK